MATDDQVPAQQRPAPTFELKRFAWATPDRLELSGTFGGLQDAPADAAPVLAVRAGDSVHRLPAVADSLDGPPQEGRVWQATFDVAGRAGRVRRGGAPSRRRPRRPAPRAEREAVALAHARAAGGRPAAGGGAGPHRTRAREPPNDGAASVASQVEVLAAQEEVREVRVALERTEAELARARDDLQAERERRAGDSERFREGLAKVRESAEKALAVEQSASRQLGTDLREAHEAITAKDTELETLQGRLEAAGAALEAAETKALAEAESQREHLAKLESDAKETGRLRTELEQAYGSVEEARSDAERILARLTAIRAK